jgi:tyrosine-protein phosphatase SIW14
MRDVLASDMRTKLFVAALTLVLAPASAQVEAQTNDAARQTRATEQTRATGQTFAELPNFHAVNARLYRGGQPRADGLRRLAALGIKTVINLRDDDERARAEEKEAKAAGLRYFNVPLGRLGRPKDTEVEHVLALIDAPENGVVFVHCAKGQDRTGTVVAVYRITHDGWTSEQAKREANRYGMKFWQSGMKDYISDYYRDHFTGKR